VGVFLADLDIPLSFVFSSNGRQCMIFKGKRPLDKKMILKLSNPLQNHDNSFGRSMNNSTKSFAIIY
jgi:hypothetical protein